MNLQLTAPTERGFARLRIVLTALICGLVFTAMVAPHGAFAAETTPEDTSVTFSVPNPNGDDVVYVIGSAAPAGSSGQANGDGTLTYTPALDFAGNGSIKYQLCPTATTCAPAITVQVTVTAVNDPPVAVDDPAPGKETNYTLAEDSVKNLSNITNGLLNNDSDIDGPSLTAVLDAGPQHGTIAVKPNGKFTYTPTLNYNGNDSFTYKAFDGTDYSLAATVMLTITAVADAIELSIPLTETVVPTPTSNLITIPVELADVDGEVVGLNFDLNYAASCLMPYPDVAGAVTYEPQAGSAILLPPSEPSAGKIRFGLSDGALVPLIDGIIANVVFEYVDGCGVNPLTDSEIWFSDVDAFDSDAAPIPVAPLMSPSINLIVNTAPEDITRTLEHPSMPGSGMLPEGVITETHFANLATVEMTASDPEFSATDATDHIFTLEDSGCGALANDNAILNLQGARGSELHFNSLVTIDFETKINYRACVRSTDPHGAYWEKRLFFGVADQDEAPSEVAIDNDEIAENMGDVIVGTLTTTDTDVLTHDMLATDHVYSIVGVMDASNTAMPTTTFVISGTANDELWTGLTCCDHEMSDSYDVTVRSTDIHDPEYIADPMVAPPTLTLFVDQVITIVITDVNEKPGNITPTAFNIGVSSGIGTQVGVFTTVDDPDVDDLHTYSFCNNPGGTDNAKFLLNPTSGALTTNDFMKLNQSPYSICVKTTDNGTPPLSKKKNVIVTVVDNNQAPSAIDDTIDPAVQIVVGSDLYNVGANSLTYDGPANILVLVNDTDPEGDVVKVKTPAPANNPKTTTAGGQALYSPGSIAYTAPTAGPAAGVDTFTYNAKDDNGASSAAPATVTLNYVMEHQLGDCNGDNTLNSQDFVMGIQEFFEFSGIEWYEIYDDGDFAGSPWGCNTIRDLNINILDVVCTVNTFLGNACGSTTVQASSVKAPATLAVDADLTASAGESIQVPVNFTNNGDGVAIGFFVKINPDHLAFDATDSDGNGLPDAISLDASQGLDAYVTYDESTGEVKFAAYNVPFQTLADGTIATLNFTVQDGVSLAESDIQLTQTSLSDQNAVAVPMDSTDGRVMIGGAESQGSSSVKPELYLPLLVQ